jgi:LysR family transcriptional activator of glutamate synthase operon
MVHKGGGRLMPTLLKLSYFKALAENEHLTRTAESLSVSQTALSNMIIQLEEELGVKLFDRTGRSIRLNAHGKAYLAHVNRIFDELENGRIELKNISESAEKCISMAMTSSYLWADMIGSFKKKHPSYSIRQHEDNPESYKDQLKSRVLDFVIAGKEDFPSRGLASKVIRRERIMLSVLPSHRLSGRDSVLLSELADEPFVSLPKGTPFRRFCDNLCRQAGFKPNTVMECDYMMRSKLIEYGYGVCLTTQTAADMNFLGPVCYIPLADSFAIRSISLFWISNRTMTKPVRDFYEYVIEYFRPTPDSGSKAARLKRVDPGG